MNKLGRLIVMLGAAAVGSFGSIANANEGYPNRPVRFIIPFAAGGAADVIGRATAEILSEGFGQRFVVDNRTGAGGSIGSLAVAQSPPDGYTIGLATIGTHSINAILKKDTGYDPVADFSPIARLATVPITVLVNPSLPVKTVPELVAYLKKQKPAISYASAGTGTSGHLAAELFKKITSTEITHVPYRGSSQFLPDIQQGRVPLAFDYVPSSLPFIESGHLRAIAISGTQRASKLPEVPTMDEQGYKQFDISTWYAVFGPKDMPEALVMRINKVLAENAPKLQKRLIESGVDIAVSSPAELTRFQKGEIERWTRLISETGIAVEGQ